MAQADPIYYQLFGDYLALSWQDGHESLIQLERVRKACPCAGCKGEPDLLGRTIMPADAPEHNADSFSANMLQPVGHYGLQIFWADGHKDGIYTFEYLRMLCDCDICISQAVDAKQQNGH